MKPSLRAVNTHVGARLVDCRAGRLHARERKIEIVKRIVLVAGRILDRQTGDAGLAAQPHAFGDAVRIVGEAAFEIGIDRNVGDSGQFAQMREHHLARHRAVAGSPA